MVGAHCGQWSYRYRWISDRLADQDPRRPHSYVDPKEPARYWFIVCRSNCELNAVRHASVELEEEAAATMWWDFQAVKRAVEEPREAWIRYYAYW